MVNFLLTHRRIVIVILQLGLVALANYLAFWTQFDGRLPDNYLAMWRGTVLWLLVVRGVTFMPFRLYEGFWRYTDVWDLRNILAGVFTSTMLFSFLMDKLVISDYPRSTLLIDSTFLVFFMAGVRFLPRVFHEIAHYTNGKRVLIYGAGDAGEIVVRDMKRRALGYTPIGFIDDDPKKRGTLIHGVPVLGARQDLAQIFAKEKPLEVLIAMPGADPRTVRQIVQALEPFKAPMKTLPGLRDILSGAVNVSHIRDLAIEDLLIRPPVHLDLEPVVNSLTNKCVLVTGAGGSIGSELCRQIARCNPKLLVMLDKAESALYDIDIEVGQWLPAQQKVAFLADIKNTARLHEMFVQYEPEIVFHAAAYKHVPMMEAHPEEGILNNVIGTRRLCEAAARYGVEKFVQISTDKAVNPTNVMGATKRLCELYIQALVYSESRGRTVFCGVRFGNVLGSNGSVVPLFLRQIKSGGPVTVTHPDITRYFMTIAEAVQLVLQAAPLARGGEIFVLDMGDQIRILDMARHLIQLSGFIPHDEIPILFSGLRPGEKLYEELVGRDERVEHCGVEKIQRVHPVYLPNLQVLLEKIERLERLAEQGDSEALVTLLAEAAPTFTPEERAPILCTSPEHGEMVPDVVRI